ncbi:uncharacterized protein [Onthophagus taurus]|uniref:uncharacterized protein isoform X2 n=1 Tax=Onthophagus taurus TaxID=166361 RepID=UPI0039BE443D
MGFNSRWWNTVIAEQKGDTTISDNTLESPSPPKSARRRRTTDRGVTMMTSSADFSINNNNNHVKNERLSPGTPDNSSSRSRSVTPSSASHPDTPPAETNPLLVGGRNYSDFMRSLAAKYNNSGPNDYFTSARNGFHPPLDPRFKTTPFPSLLPLTAQPPTSKDESAKKTDFSSILHSSFPPNNMFPHFIDMSTTQALIAMARTAKDAEIQGLLKNAKRSDPSSPLDLSPAAPQPAKKPRLKPISLSDANTVTLSNNKIENSESPHNLHEDISGWSVEDVYGFVSGIDICAEYAQNFKDQRIDGAGLPLLTEDHLTTTMGMKLGPALKLKSILAKKLGSCSVCLHCTHCHNNSSTLQEASSTGNSSDSNGTKLESE